MTSRRQFLALTSSVALTPFFSVAVAETGQVVGVYRRGIGDITVTALLDGYLQIDPASLTGADPEKDARLIAEAFLSAGPIDTSVNAFVLETGDRTVLVDGGAASAFGPTLGKLPSALEAAGVAPESVDTIFCTHLHPDHIGAFTDASGAAAFPNAELVLNSVEHGFWTDDANFTGAPEAVQGFVAAARGPVAAYGDRLKLVEDGAEIAPGVTAVHLPGHTPGHTGLTVASGDAALMIWADIVHVGPIQFARPDVTIAFDVDQPLAAQTRARVFDQVATDQLEIAGAHIDFPSFGRLVPHREGYIFVKSRWDHEL